MAHTVWARQGVELKALKFKLPGVIKDHFVS